MSGTQKIQIQGIPAQPCTVTLAWRATGDISLLYILDLCDVGGGSQSLLLKEFFLDKDMTFIKTCR